MLVDNSYFASKYKIIEKTKQICQIIKFKVLKNLKWKLFFILTFKRNFCLLKYIKKY